VFAGCADTMVAQLAQPAIDIGIIRGDHAAVAQAAEVLGGIEAECAGIPECTDGAATDGGTEALCAVFDDDEIVFLRDRHELRHRRWQTEQMHRNKSACPGRDGGLDLADVMLQVSASMSTSAACAPTCWIASTVAATAASKRSTFFPST
jgi:hypothetical protein